MIDRLLGRLSRRTSSGRFIAEIDGLRFVAIALVVVFHLSAFSAVRSPMPFSTPASSTVFGAFASTGHYGVQLFFIISGFVLALPFAMHSLTGAPAVSLRKYFLRRVTRLEPPYVIAMIACTVALVATHRFTAGEALPHLGVGLLYLHNILYADSNPLNTVVWSLEIEVQFYCLVPLFAKVFDIRNAGARRATIAAIAVGFMVLQHMGISDAPILRLTLLNFAQFFLMGFLLADFYMLDWRNSTTGTAWWDVASLVGWPVLVGYWIGNPFDNWITPFTALALFAAALRGPMSRRVFGNRWLTTIGGMCYSIYLLHYPLISFIGRATRGIGTSSHFEHYVFVQGLLILPPLLVVSAVYFALIERPCMNSAWPHELMQWLRGNRVRRTVSVRDTSV
jgi:peptidoglycan/LPS O-acetylase OafA/YrhL